MSGPIVRKYGFPNFEKIFGEREVQHGVEDEPAKREESTSDAEKAKPKPKRSASKKKKG
jgi:hypothetical protein